MLKKLISILIVIILLLVPFVALAATTGELNEQKSQIEQEKAEAEAKRKVLEGQITQNKSELDKLNDQIAEKEYQVEQITAELNKLNSEVSSLTSQLEEAEKNYDSQYDKLCKRLAAQYKKGKTTYLDVLLNSSTLTEFVSNYYIIERIAELDTNLLEEIENEKQKISAAKNEVVVKQKQVAEKHKQLEIEETTLINTKIVKNDHISKLTNEEKALQSEIDKFNSSLKEIENEIARQAAASMGGEQYTGGKLEWPTPSSYRITSYFGYRGSAATGGVGTANHNGYDIGAAHYSDIIAAESGVVTKVVSGCTHDYPKTFSTRCYCGGGYGNYLMIKHHGLTTLYGHVSKIHVSVGQQVSRGQKIASVGSAGWSTGYHLHFSVINSSGKYVNPGDYLGK